MINTSKSECNFFFTALQPYKWTSTAANLLDEFIKAIQKNRRFILVSQGWAGRITSRPILIPVLRTSKITLTFISNKAREIDEIVYLCQKTEKISFFFFFFKKHILFCGFIIDKPLRKGDIL